MSIKIEDIKNNPNFDMTEIANFMLEKGYRHFDYNGEETAYAIAKQNYDYYEKTMVNHSNEARLILEKIKNGHIPDELECFILVTTDQLQIEKYREFYEIRKRAKKGSLTMEDFEFLCDEIGFEDYAKEAVEEEFKTLGIIEDDQFERRI